MRAGRSERNLVGRAATLGFVVVTSVALALGWSDHVGREGPRATEPTPPEAGDTLVLAVTAPAPSQRTSKSTTDQPDASPQNGSGSSSRLMRGLVKRPRPAIRGVLELDRDDPEARCKILLKRPGSDRWSNSTKTFEGGGPFEMEANRPGVYDLHVSVPGHGVANVLGVEFALPPNVLETPIRLTGSGVLRVRVEDHEGRPTTGLRVHVAMSERPDGSSPLWYDPDGQSRGVLTTGADGRGELRGLAPGLYHVGIADRARTSPIPTRRTADSVPPDGREVSLVHSDPRILVHLVGRTEAERSWKRPKSQHQPPWPVAPVVQVLRRVDGVEGASPSFVRTRLRPIQVDPDSLRYDVVAGTRYRVVAFGGDCPAQVVDVEVPQPSGTIEVQLDLSKRVEHGSLTLVMPYPPPLEPDGGPTTGDAFDWYEVLLRDRATGTRLSSAPILHGVQSEVTFELAAGSYMVDVRGATVSSKRHTRFGRDRFDVDLAPGAHVRHELASEPLAFLELTTRVERESPPARANDDSIEGPYREQLSAWIVSSDGFEQGVPFVGWEETVGTHLRPGPWPWDELRSTGLPAGRYRLHAELEDERKASADVLLTPGATTRVELVFPPAEPLPERRFGWWEKPMASGDQ